MSTQTNDETSQLADDAQALIAATADVAGDKVGEARRRLSAAVKRAKELAITVREKTVAGAKATDEAIHEHPYQAIGIGVAVGVLIGYLIGRRNSRD